MYAIKQPPPQVDPPYTFDLFGISKYDAEVIVELCNSIGGVRTGPRGTFDRLKVALIAAGVMNRYNTSPQRHIAVHPCIDLQQYP